MTQRDANLLGALALVIADRTSDAVAAASGQSQTAATALSALHHFLDAPSIDMLRQVLGLTSSGAVRLVDRLEEADYVTRRPGTDGRSVSVLLTESGRRAAERVSAARAAVLESAVGELSPDERGVFEQLVSRVLATMVRGPGAKRWICRLCDTGTCGSETGRCPVRNAAVAKFLP